MVMDQLLASWLRAILISLCQHAADTYEARLEVKWLRNPHKVSASRRTLRLPLTTRQIYNQLPQELHDRIFDFVEQHARLQLCKTLRLVSKYFREVASPLVFHTILLYEHPNRWVTLNNIARRPDIAKHVKRIQLASLHELPCQSEQAYQRYEKAYRYDPRRRLCSADRVMVQFAHSAICQRHENYLSLDGMVQAEVEANKEWQDRDPPRINLHLFGPLTVETLNPSKLAFILDGTTDLKYLTEVGQIPSLPGGPLVTAQHLHQFILASKVAGSNITSLMLHHVGMLMQHDGGLALPTLRHLKLDLQPFDAPRNYSWKGTEKRRLSVWLLIDKLPRLEELVIVQYPTAKDAPNLFDLFRQTHFPALSRVLFTCPETTYAALSDFIYQHLDTIKLLHVSNPLMSPSDWLKFRSDFTGPDFEEKTRYSGKNFDLAPYVLQVVQDLSFEEIYWNERLKRPQDPHRLELLANAVH